MENVYRHAEVILWFLLTSLPFKTTDPLHSGSLPFALIQQKPRTDVLVFIDNGIGLLWSPTDVGSPLNPPSQQRGASEAAILSVGRPTE